MAIKKLVQYGLDKGLITEVDRIYAVNQLLDVLGLDEYEEPETIEGPVVLEEVLGELLDYACEHGLVPENTITYRDLFDTRLMNCLMPRPGEVVHVFWKKYQESAKKATDYFYKLSQDSDFIRRYRLCRDM